MDLKLKNLVIVELLIDLEGVNDLIGEVGTFGATTTRTMVADEEWGGSAGELEEVDEVEANGAFDGRIGELKHVDYGGSVVLVMNAKQHTQLSGGTHMLDCPPSHNAFVFL